MSYIHYATVCYPEFESLIRAIRYVPLTTRSLLIKSCQAQHDFDSSSTAPLALLLKNAPDIVLPHAHMDVVMTIPPIDFLKHFNASPQDKIDSCIILDLLRGVPVQPTEERTFKYEGWEKEIQLSETKSVPDINFEPLFHPVMQPIHPDLPYNPASAYKIRRTFERFRDRYKEKLQFLYPRSTHKNMSRSTARSFKDFFGVEATDESNPIFGQDDWQRVYHETGVELEGVVEMRQKWYPAQAKPRTYFAMGGTCYRASRFLQDFFSQLVNIFPSTNHVTRLLPHRLRIPVDEPGSHYRIYDLSSFTSNMRQQRSFCSSLAGFMRGIEVVIVDERQGPTIVDFGDLLDEYNEYCVFNPHLSYERSPSDIGWNGILDTDHLNASMLGIFGNLMTCTLAHFLILTPLYDSPEEVNETAGDDGLTLETALNKWLLLFAISLVGSFAAEKLYRSDDEGAVCLKRPLMEDGYELYLASNFVPPNLATCLSLLLGKPVDSRFTFYDLEEMTIEERVSTVGKDLLRFLRSIYYRQGYEWFPRAIEVFRGWGRVVKRITGSDPDALMVKSGFTIRWPVDPATYPFFDFLDPHTTFALTYMKVYVGKRRGVEPVEVDALRYSGDVSTGNLDPRIRLLEVLGYIEKVEVEIHYQGLAACVAWDADYAISGRPLPQIYEFSCVKDVPECFLFSE